MSVRWRILIASRSRWEACCGPATTSHCGRSNSRVGHVGDESAATMVLSKNTPSPPSSQHLLPGNADDREEPSAVGVGVGVTGVQPGQSEAWIRHWRLHAPCRRDLDHSERRRVVASRDRSYRAERTDRGRARPPAPDFWSMPETSKLTSWSPASGGIAVDRGERSKTDAR